MHFQPCLMLIAVFLLVNLFGRKLGSLMKFRVISGFAIAAYNLAVLSQRFWPFSCTAISFYVSEVALTAFLQFLIYPPDKEVGLKVTYKSVCEKTYCPLEIHLRNLLSVLPQFP